MDVTGSGAELQLRDVTLESYERAVVIDVTGGGDGEVTAPPAPAAPPRTTAGASQTTLPPAAVSSLDLLPPPPPPPPSPTATPVIVDTSTDVASVWLLVGAPLAAGLLLALCAIVLVRRFGLGRGDPRERRSVYFHSCMGNCNDVMFCLQGRERFPQALASIHVVEAPRYHVHARRGARRRDRYRPGGIEAKFVPSASSTDCRTEFARALVRRVHHLRSLRRIRRSHPDATGGGSSPRCHRI